MSDWIVVSFGGFLIILLLGRSGWWLWRSSHLKKFADHDPRGLKNVYDAAHMSDHLGDHSGGDFGGDAGHA